MLYAALFMGNFGVRLIIENQFDFCSNRGVSTDTLKKLAAIRSVKLFNHRKGREEQKDKRAHMHLGGNL